MCNLIYFALALHLYLANAKVIGMNLNTYLEKFSGPERREFAEKCGLAYTHLSQLANHHRYASGGTCAVIERESSGEVTAKDMRPDWFGGALPKPVKRKTAA